MILLDTCFTFSFDVRNDNLIAYFRCAAIQHLIDADFVGPRCVFRKVLPVGVENLGLHIKSFKYPLIFIGIFNMETFKYQGKY